MTDVTSTITRSTDGYAAATLCNASFEDESLDGWTLTGLTDGTWPSKSYQNDGTYGLSFGSSSSYTMTLSQDISYFTYGTYTFSMDVMGNSCSDTMYVYATVNGVQTKTTAKMTSWDTWNTYSVSFTADLDDTVEVGFYISTSNIWGYVDNAVLTRTDSGSGSGSGSSTVSFTNDIENGTFDDDYDDWTITADTTPSTIQIKTDSNATNNTTSLLNVWGGTSVGIEFDITQDVSGNSGTMEFSIEFCSDSFSDCEIYAYVSVNGTVTKSTTVTSTSGWDNWQTATVSGVSVTVSDTVVVGLYVNIPDSSSYIYIDNATLSVS